jgi:hypothetical protein
MSELLSDTAVTDNNIMQFLGVIEQRANEIMQRLAAVSRDVTVDRGSSVPAGAGAGAGAGGGGGSGSAAATPVAPPSPTPGATLASLLGHGPTTQHGAEMLTTVDPPKIDDYSSVRRGVAAAWRVCAYVRVYVCVSGTVCAGRGGGGSDESLQFPAGVCGGSHALSWKNLPTAARVLMG